MNLNKIYFQLLLRCRGYRLGEALFFIFPIRFLQKHTRSFLIFLRPVRVEPHIVFTHTHIKYV